MLSFPCLLSTGDCMPLQLPSSLALAFVDLVTTHGVSSTNLPSSLLCIIRWRVFLLAGVYPEAIICFIIVPRSRDPAAVYERISAASALVYSFVFVLSGSGRSMADISGDSDAVDFSRQTVDPVANPTTNMMSGRYSIQHDTLCIMIDVLLIYGMMKQHHEHGYYLHHHGDLFLIQIQIDSDSNQTSSKSKKGCVMR